MKDQFKELTDAADFIRAQGQDAFIDLRIVSSGVVIEGYLSWDRAPAPSFSRVCTWEAIEGRPAALKNMCEVMINTLQAEFRSLRNRSAT